MDKAARASLLRERLTAVRGYALPAPVGPKRKRVPVTRGVLVYLNFGVPTGNREVAAKFLREPDPEPERPLRTKRTARTHPLTKIAAKWRTFKPRVDTRAG